jgi:hypothetical protein
MKTANYIHPLFRTGLLTLGLYAAHKTGGGDFSGWSVDLERYGNESDMWVDWVRVYSGR